MGGICNCFKHALSLSSQWISLSTAYLSLIPTSVAVFCMNCSTVQHFSQSATNLLLLVLQMLSLVWCAFSAFSISGQRIHPFPHQVAVQLPVCCYMLRSLACETALHDTNLQHTVETLLLSILFPLFMPQHRKSGWEFMIICLNYISWPVLVGLALVLP